MSTEASLFDKFESLRDSGVFAGTIDCRSEEDSENDIEKDGGRGKKIVSLFKSPALNLMKMLRSETPNNVSLSIVQQRKRGGVQETRKFYFRTKIMEAFDNDVHMETVDSPTTPLEGQFIMEDHKFLKNLDDVYVVLNKKKELTSVHKDDIEDAFLVCLTIFSSERGHGPQSGDTAIYFPSSDNKYHYYLKPVDDSSKPQCPIDIVEVCIAKMSEDQKEQNIREYLFFSQQYNNQGYDGSQLNGARGTGPSHQSFPQYSHHHTAPTLSTAPLRSQGLTLSGEVEKG